MKVSIRTIIAFMLLGASLAPAQFVSPGSAFDASPPTRGLWKGWPLGTTTTVRRTLHLTGLDSEAFDLTLLVGSSEDGKAIVAGYRGGSPQGPWTFARSFVADWGGFVHEPGILKISERTDQLFLGGVAYACVVRGYSGVRQTQVGEHVDGEEWTLGADGPAIQSKIYVSYLWGGSKCVNVDQVAAIDRETSKVGTKDVPVFQTVEETYVQGKAVGGRSRFWWSTELPGALARRRFWNSEDETQPATTEEALISYGPAADLLDRYRKEERPAEVSRNAAAAIPLAVMRASQELRRAVATSRATTRP